MCAKSCDITLPCHSTCFFGFCRCLCQFNIFQLVNKNMCTLSIRGYRSAICIYDGGVKVSYTPQLQTEPSSKKYQFSRNRALMLPRKYKHTCSKMTEGSRLCSIK